MLADEPSRQYYQAAPSLGSGPVRDLSAPFEPADRERVRGMGETVHLIPHPKGLGGTEAEAFSTHSKVERNVAASTQNQAKSALLFLFKHVLGIDLPWPRVPAAARRQRPAAGWGSWMIRAGALVQSCHRPRLHWSRADPHAGSGAVRFPRPPERRMDVMTIPQPDPERIAQWTRRAQAPEHVI
jgi:hypothetical protein